MPKILVVEDDPVVQKLILKLLQSEGFETIHASNGLQGVQFAQLYRPDLIICDVMMPECDGYGVIDQLRQKPATATIPFIFLTAKADRTDRRQGMELGADDYITKPFKRDELLRAIATRLARQTAITQPYRQEMRRTAQTLTQMTNWDTLTNLPNRRLFQGRLMELLTEGGRSPAQIAVICVALNYPTFVRTSLNHAAQEVLLQEASERLRQAFGQNYLLARVGGNQFGLVMDDLIHAQELDQTVRRLLQLLADPYSLDEASVQPQVSIGIARSSNPDGPLQGLLDCAMQAMHQAQREGGNRFIHYHDNSLPLPLTEVNLTRAMQQGELQLYYQPQIHLITGKVIGTEVLLRWHHPELGMLLPASFLPLAQATGQMVALGEWVIQTACTQLQQWQEQIHLSLKVAVNLSGLELNQPNLVEKVHHTLQETGLDPHLLVLEMGETSLMQQQDVLVKQLHRFKQMGVQICIDDFGTGFSSFSALRKFPVSLLKIDQRFMEDIPGDASSVAIARAIIAMAQSLQVKVIAEGVETEEQLAFLRQTGCYAVQGYLFSPPITATEFGKLLACNPRL